jgi:hypothetical protein
MTGKRNSGQQGTQQVLASHYCCCYSTQCCLLVAWECDDIEAIIMVGVVQRPQTWVVYVLWQQELQQATHKHAIFELMNQGNQSLAVAPNAILERDSGGNQKQQAGRSRQCSCAWRQFAEYQVGSVVDVLGVALLCLHQ